MRRFIFLTSILLLVIIASNYISTPEAEPKRIQSSLEKYSELRQGLLNGGWALSKRNEGYLIEYAKLGRAWDIDDFEIQNNAAYKKRADYMLDILKHEPISGIYGGSPMGPSVWFVIGEREWIVLSLSDSVTVNLMSDTSFVMLKKSWFYGKK